MGLFHLFKSNQKKTNKNIVYEYHGYDELPDDYDVLGKMYDYYDDLYYQTNDLKYEEARFMIVKKWKEVGDNQIPYVPTHHARFVYNLYYGTKEELAAYYFDEFIYSVKNTVIDSSALKNRKMNNLFSMTLFGASFSDYAGNKFEYHEQDNLTKEENNENALVEYYENHFDELIDVIFELIDKQEKDDVLTYTGYYMYKDLCQFFVDSNQRFSKKIWVSTKDYNEYCHNYYDDCLLYKINDHKNDLNIIKRRNQIAIDNKNIYDRESLLAFAKNYHSSRKVIKAIKQYSYIYENDDERNKVFNQIVDLSKNIRFTTEQGNSIAAFLCLLAKKYQDDQAVEKISNYLKDINQNRIKTPLDGTNLMPTKIGQVDKRKRELYADKHHLPSFRLSYSNRIFETIVYHETDDGKWAIESDIISAYEYKKGDIVESIETGEKFVIDYIGRPLFKDGIFRPIRLICDHKYYIDREWFVKID